MTRSLSPEARVKLAAIITDALVAVRQRSRDNGLPVPPWAAELHELHDVLLSNAASVTAADRRRALTRARVARYRARRRASAA